MSGEQVSKSDIDRANEDIVEVVRGYLPDLKRAGKNYSACCPFHKEKSPSFTVNESKAMYYCFGCGEGGDAVKFVREMNPGMSFRDAVRSILGDLTLESSKAESQRRQVVRAVRCELPGHAEDREKAASAISNAVMVDQHRYLKAANTAPCGQVATIKGSLVVPLINNIGEQVNLAAITSSGITYAAGNPSFGSTAILEPACTPAEKTIICIDYAHAWRIWWAQRGKSRVLCCMEYGNFRWMIANCRERFTHIGCDIADADEHADNGYGVVVLPVSPYAKLDTGTPSA